MTFHIVVCIKQVPDPEFLSEITIDPSTKTIRRKGVPVVINPLDKCALEEALRIREKYGGAVTVISMGPPEAEEAIREAFAMGADEGILLCDKAFAGADTLATSYTLALGIRKLGKFDLILCGNETVDGGTGQVPPQLAEFLGIPHVTYVRKIEFLRKSIIKVERIVEHGYMIVEIKLPALLAVTKNINKPRYPTVYGILLAKEKKVNVWGCEDIGADRDRVGVTGSPTCILNIFTPEFRRAKIILKGKPQEVSKELIEKLIKLGVF
jgi:electron transfer flavoprotein beta subunit